MQKFISVLIVDQAIDSKGVVANAAYVLGLTAGRDLPQETFGPDVVDGDGATHRYLTRIGHVVRKAGQNKLKSLRQTLAGNPDVLLVDYTEDAAPADYEEYAETLAKHSREELKYRALHVYGPEEIIAPLTKNLSRLD
ncbi:MAG TPA: DUF2000 domain-containing protein [Chloroflexia bacterium]|nr:DUF2000 domain-containing protein [Chloroflexia bacterium]